MRCWTASRTTTVIIKDEALLAEFRACPCCQWCFRPGSVEPHHWKPRGHGGGSRLDVRINLIAVDRWCHEAMEAKRISPRAVLLVIAIREKTTPEKIEEEIWRLLRTPKGKEALCTNVKKSEDADAG